MRTRAAVAGWLFVLSAGLAGAQPGQPGPLDRTEQDKRTAQIVYESALLGSELYNRNNHEGCYRLFQGTLLAVHPMLDHRPKLAAFVKEKLNKAALLPPAKAADAAVVLREALDEVQKETVTAFVPAKKGGDPLVPEKKTGAALWDRLGGEKVVRVVVKDFVASAGADPKVNFTRGGKYKLDEKGVAKLESSLVELVSQVTGGPLKYTGKDMATVHAGMKITSEEFFALTRHVVDAMKKNNVPIPEQHDLLGVLGATRGEIVGK